ncbi:MAG: hypothetical protein WCQ16_01900 [Verrucomicrobiae bacterium]
MKTKKSQPENITVKGVSVTIYSTPSVKAGKEYPGWTLSYTEAGKRIRRSVANLDKARTIAKSIAGQLAAGTGHAHALTPSELSDYQGAIRILRQAPGVHLTAAVSTFAQAFAIMPDAGDILTGVRFYQAHLKKQGVSAVSVAVLVDEFLKAREQQGACAAYRTNCKSTLARFAGAFRCNVASIATADIQGFIDRLPGSPVTRESQKKKIVTLFHFARERGYLPREQSTEADHLDTITIPPSPVGTYRLGDIQNAAQVALEAGNSPAKIFQHYRELATKQQASAWFAARPAGKGRKVSSMKEAA